MNYNVYAIRNTMSGLSDGLFLFATDEHAAFELTNRIKPEQRDYTEILRVGMYDIRSHYLTGCDCCVIPFSQRSIDLTGRKSEVSTDSPEKQVVDFAQRTSDIH